jgi:hypothetical protein
MMLSLLFAILLCMLAVMTWRREEAGLALLAAWLPAYLIRFEGIVPVTFLELAIIVFVGTVYLKHYTKLCVTWQQGTLLGFFLLAGTVGVIAAEDKIAALGLWKAYVIEPAAFGFALWLLPHSKKTLLRSFLLGAGSVGAVMGLLAGIQYLTGWNIPAPWDAEDLRRAVGFFEYPNALGLFLAPIAAGWLVAGWKGWLGRAPWWIIVSFLHIIGIATSVSQGAVIAVSGALLVFIYRYRSRLLAVLTTSILLGVGLLTPSIREVLFLQDVSGEVRRVLWLGTSRLLAAHPFTGSGLGGFPAMYDQFREARHVELLLYPHNLLLDFWTQFGILGAVFVLLAGALVFWPVWKKPSVEHGIILAGLTAIFIYGLVDVPYFKNDLAIICWTFLALGVKHLWPNNKKNVIIKER